MILQDGFEVLTPTSSEKIGPSHLERLAVIYVRQSTAQQVLDHQESTRLQYGLVARARRMGWPEERILLIDDDLGKSGSDSEGRVGFKRLVSEVGLDHVGIILGVEMSRLARSSKDWHQLLEICALFGTLIADLDGVYDPSQYNEIIRTQLTKTGRFSPGIEGNDVADLHFLIAHDDSIDQQFHQSPLLFEGGMRQATVHSLAETLYGAGQIRDLHAPIGLSLQLPLVGCQRLLLVLEVLSASSVLGQRDHLLEVRLGQPLQLAL